MAEAFRKLPELSFLSPAEIARIAEVEEGLRASQHPKQLDLIPRLKAAVDTLQNERRIRYRALDHLRALRRERRGQMLAADPALSSLHRQAKIDLDQKIEALQKELSALAQHGIPLRNQLGHLTILAAAQATSRETNTLILNRSTLVNAAGQLAHKGVGKGISVHFHSAQDGAIAGFIPYQQRLSRKVFDKGPEFIAKKQKEVEDAIASGQVVKFPLRVGTMAAVEREGKVVFVDFNQHYIDESEIVEVIGVLDDQWMTRPLVSDVDPLAFGRKLDIAPETPINSPTHGIITPHEHMVVEIYNRNASEILGGRARKFMAHGAENRNPNSSGISGYPITAHFPDGEMRAIPEGPAENPDLYLQDFFREARRRGYQLDVNPLWGWPPL